MNRIRLSAAAGLASLFLISPAAAGARRYLVVPFENRSAERHLSWVGEAIAMSVSDRLELLGMRTVPRPERLDAAGRLSLPSASPPSIASILRLAGMVRASRVVTGHFTYDPNSGVSVSARLIDTEDPRVMWDGNRPGTLAGIFSLLDPLVLEAAARDESRVAAVAPSALGGIGDPPLPQYERLVRGLLEPESERRIAALEKGLEMNRHSPHLLRALAAEQAASGRTAQALVTLDRIPEKALPDAWRLHLLRARILAADGDVAGAVAALSRSIAAGESADAHILLARLHSARGETALARAETDLAAGLDPAHPDLADAPDARSAPRR